MNSVKKPTDAKSDFMDALDTLAGRVERELLWLKLGRAVELLALPPADEAVDVKEDVTDTATFDVWTLEIKAVDDEAGVVTGYASTWDKDLVNDIIEPGAFARTIAESKAFARAHKQSAILPVLWQHDKHEPIGCVFAADEDRKGLRIRCRLNRDIARGKQAYDGLRNGYMSFSIGYKPVKYSYKGNIRHLHEIGLGEVSAVTFPANPEARADGEAA